MKRYEALGLITDCLGGELLVSNIGSSSQELFAIKDRDENFYMLGSMGMASSIGLGLALSQKKKVVAIDGDGSILMNCGSLATVAHNKPKNLILIIIDNKAYGSTGYQKTFTASCVNLKNVAKGFGIENVFYAKDKSGLRKILQGALSKNKLAIIIVNAGRDDKPVKPVPLTSIQIKEKFMRCL